MNECDHSNICWSSGMSAHVHWNHTHQTWSNLGLKNAMVYACSRLRKIPFSIKLRGVRLDSLRGSRLRQSSMWRMCVRECPGDTSLGKRGKNAECDRAGSWAAVQSRQASQLTPWDQGWSGQTTSSNTYWMWAAVEGMWPWVRWLSVAEDVP